MSTITTTAKFNDVASTYEGHLNELTKAKDKSASRVRYLGISFLVVVLALLVSFIIFAYFYYPSEKMSFYCYTPINWLIFAAMVLFILAGVIMLSLSASASKKADYYRDELIVLRDLYFAMDLTQEIDKANIKKTYEKAPNGNVETVTTLQARMQEQIVKKLLDRCG